MTLDRKSRQPHDRRANDRHADEIIRPPVRERVDRELAFHIDMRTRELVARGVPEAEARAQAIAAFGNITDVTTELQSLERDTDRAMRRTRYVAEFAQDIRFALRMLWRRRTFSAIAVATLALGIGAATAIYSVVDGVLLKPLPFPESDRLVAVWITQPSLANDPTISWLADATPMGNGEFQALRQQSTTLRDLSLFGTGAVIVDGAEGAERVRITQASNGVLATLRTQVAFGRGFQHGDDALHAAPVALVSHEAWQSRFAGDSAIVGRSIVLNNEAFTVVGVLPPGLRIDRTAEPTPFWIPALRDSSDLPERRNRNYRAIARLAPGSNTDVASQEAAQIFRTAAGDSTLRARVSELQWDETRNARRPLFILLGAAGLLMVIACANIAVLLLGEGATRAKEFAARAALGAASSRLVRQLLTESLAIAAVGTAAGVLVALLMMRALILLAPTQLPGLDEVGLDFRVLAFTIACGVVTGTLFGVVPAFTSARGNASAIIRSGVGQTSRGLPALQRGLIGLELALSMMLLVGATLLARSLDRLSAIDPGFRPDGLTVLPVSLPWPQYSDNDKIRALALELHRRIAGIPGVEQATMSSGVPFVGGNSSSPVAIEGREYTSDDRPRPTQQRYVLPGYFEILGMRLLAGRFFEESDREGGEPVAVVTAAMVQRDFGGASPLGKRVRHQGAWRRVVGVVADVKYRGLSVEDESTIYVPFGQHPNVGYYVVRTAVGVRIEPAVKRVLHELEPRAVVRQVTTLPTALSRSYAEERYRTTLVSAFGVIAALLAAVGMYGVGARAAASRTREMGIRLALGGTGARIVRLMLRDAMKGVTIGLVLGIPAALLGGRIIEPFLFDISAHDPWSFGVVALVLVSVTLVATIGPARRAAKVDPARVLRSD